MRVQSLLPTAEVPRVRAVPKPPPQARDLFHVHVAYACPSLSVSTPRPLGCWKFFLVLSYIVLPGALLLVQVPSLGKSILVSQGSEAQLILWFFDLRFHVLTWSDRQRCSFRTQ
jgi:hypothetical protein